MATMMIVFENDKERAMMCADVRHDWEKQEKIFGIAKAHGLYITWYGNGRGPCEPDRFLVSGRGTERLAFIQCYTIKNKR